MQPWPEQGQALPIEEGRLQDARGVAEVAGAPMPPELMAEGARVNYGRAGGIQQQQSCMRPHEQGTISTLLGLVPKCMVYSAQVLCMAVF
jgi:hypothetical protein